jgi:hypothetical protein
MNCPIEIADVLREILKLGILRIRNTGWADDAARCAIEADHIHNLPDLLRCYSPDLLAFYWETERISYIHQRATDPTGFEPIWERLAAFVPQGANEVLASVK